ncbi:protein fem-1 homolog B-like [Uloborus diversus]|uniref:protein fem-1 homolog B-like n=1 Tax=Uloborus diversus TaxID=327109 RepID=UPI002408F760|nr:protein fem-1 homolog B-like [Uloborus diversus]
MNSDTIPRPWMMALAEDKDSLRRRVYYAARDGMAITLYALLSNTPQDDLPLYLEHPVEDEGHKCTPLLIAALNGHDNVVRMLLNRFKPNIEQDGVVQMDGYVIEGATALWSAAGAGHFNVVKLLITRGADVNHTTKTNSTPLRGACFEGRLDIIQYLVENGANIHKANKYNNTCLMIACYRGHLDVVTYLLSKQADPDAKAHCGATALHFASEHGHLNIVKKLLEHGAKITKNKMGMTPLLSAAEKTKSEIVEYMIRDSLCSKEESVEALELLGASYANDKDSYSLEKAYYYLHWAMSERCDHPEFYAPKVLLPPIPAYENHVECQTLEELEAIKNDRDAIHMEALVIQERILGSSNPEVPHPVIFRGALFADIGRFDRCVDLWLHALMLRHTNDMTVRKDLLRFAQVFAQMIHLGEEVAFEKVKQVLEVTLRELTKNQLALKDAAEDNYETVMEELEDNMFTTLYLLVIVTKIIKKLSPSEEDYIYKLVYQVNKLNLRTSDGSSLLHLAVNTDTPVDEFHTKYVCKFPCAATSRLLIQCGAEVDVVDKAGNTPLHIIVAYQKPITDFMTLHSIITRLLEAGAHIDRANNEGESPFEAVLTGVAEIILKSQNHISLKCISAKAVKKYHIPYKGIIPKTLVAFTDMHGVSRKKKIQ